MGEHRPNTGPTSARVRFEVFTYESRAFVGPGEDPIVTLPSAHLQETEPLRDAWLYLFTWRLSKPVKGEKPSQSTPRHPTEVPILAFEIYADHEGRYHSHQQLDGPGQPHITLTIDDSTASRAATDVRYGCWISPFRVPKERLPACSATGKATNPDAMWKWLGDRSVLSNEFGWEALSSGSTRRGECYTAVARYPLRRALQLVDDAIREGVEKLKRFSRTQGYDAAELRYLHASVTHLIESRPEMGFKSWLNMNAFDATAAAIKKQDNELASIHAAVQAVERYTHETAWLELEEDMKAAGPAGYEAMAQPLAAINGVLGASPKTLRSAVKFFEKYPEVIDPGSYSDSFKSGRRGFKTMGALLKAAVDIGLANDAAHLGANPAGHLELLPDGPYQRAQNAVVNWVKTVGVDISPRKQDSMLQALEATKKGLDLPSVLWISVLVDTLNAWRAFRSTAKTSGSQRFKAYAGLTSSMASVGRSITALVELSLKRAATPKATHMVRAEFMNNTAEYEATLSRAKTMANRIGLARRVLGVVGSAADVGISVWNAQEAYAVDDFNAAFAMGISAVGSALTTAGYITAFGNPAIGGILIAAGELLNLIGTVAYAFCKNSDLENWLVHCVWGKSADSADSGTTTWSRGPLSEYHHNLTKQIIAFDELIFPIELQWDRPPTEGFVFKDDDICYLQVSCPMLSSNDSTLIVGVSGETRARRWDVVRPFGPATGRIEVRAGGYRRLVAHCKIDLYGDKQHMLPHDTYRSAEVSPLWLVPHKPAKGGLL